MHARAQTAPLPPLPLPRGGACGHIINGSCFVIGGGTSAKEHLDRVDICDLASGTWRSGARMPTARSNASSAVLDGRIYVVGGLTGPDQQEGVPSTVFEAYDPATDAWTQLAPLACPRVRPAVVGIDGCVVVIGGRRDELDTPSISAYDPKTGSWRDLGTTPFPARHLAAAVLDGRIIVAGGFQATPQAEQKGVFLDAVYAIDPRSGSYTALAPLPEPRTAHNLVAVRGKIVAVGGVDRNKALITAVDTYDPVANAWTRGRGLASGRAMAVADAVGSDIHLLSGWTKLFKIANPVGDVISV